MHFNLQLKIDQNAISKNMPFCREIDFDGIYLQNKRFNKSQMYKRQIYAREQNIKIRD